MAELNLAQTMDAIADTLTGANLVANAYAWPVGAVSVPCVVVGYPKKIVFDLTFHRGADEAVFPVWFVVGKPDDLAARDALSAVLTGAGKIKDTLDGTLGGKVSTARCVDCEVETVKVGEIDYLAALFTLEVVS